MFTLVGEALIDVVRRRDADTVTEYVGGSPANVALGLARLGAAVDLITQVGRDERGARIRQILMDAGVRLDRARVSDELTSTATATVDAAGHATYEFDLRWDPGTLSHATDSVVVHTGSLATVVEPGASATLDLLRRIGDRSLISVDPNYRPAVHGGADQARPRIEEMVALAHVVKVSDEDLAGLYPGVPTRTVMERWVTAGLALVVVTHGADGAEALGPAGYAARSGSSVTVADTVGAGDSFTAAMLHALATAGVTTRTAVAALTDDRLAMVLDHAVLASAVTCTRPGADPPSLAELNEALAAAETAGRTG